GAIVDREALLEKRREILELAVADVTIDVGEDVLDENLAAELLAEKADVAADDRAQVEQDRRLPRRQAREKLSQSFGREDGIVDHRRCGERMRIRLGLARREAVEQSHGQRWVRASKFGVRRSGSPGSEGSRGSGSREPEPEPRTTNPEPQWVLRAYALRPGGLRLGLRLLLRALLRLDLRLAPLALHVDTAAEVRAFGNCNARRDDVAVDRPVVADVNLVAGRDIPRHFAEHNHRLREHLRFDAAVGA